MEDILYNIIPERGIIHIIDMYKCEMEFVSRRKIIECDKKLYKVFRTIKRKYISMKNTLIYINEYNKRTRKIATIDFLYNILIDIRISLEKYKKLNEELFRVYYNIYNDNEYILKKMSIDLIDIIEKYVIIKKYIVEMEFELKEHLD